MKAGRKIEDPELKDCVLCGKKIKVINYADKTYGGGYYFGKVPLISKKEMNRALKMGTRKSKIGIFKMDVLKKDPKPYSYAEYWECPKCYIRHFLFSWS